MEWNLEYNDLTEYLKPLQVVDYTHPVMQKKTAELFTRTQTDMEKMKLAFEFVRDDIHHSWDIQSSKVTCHASEVVLEGEGICYAKSNVLAALLRSENIPTGFCYQRLMLFDTPEKGYCIHALNAVYVASLQKWIRLDARGNKRGIDAQFSTDEEKLAFMVQEEFGEKDYPIIYAAPHPKTISTLQDHTNALEMYLHHLPETL